MSLNVTGIGMVTSVGRDVVTSCASMRAGIARPGDIPYFHVMDEDTHQTMPLIGKPVQNLTEGMSSVARWIVMGEYAVRDLFAYSRLQDQIDSRFWSKTGFVFVTPTLDSARFAFEDIINDENVRELYVQTIFERLSISVPLDNCAVVSEDNTGFVGGCAMTQRLLENASVERVILIAADTNLNAHSLSWLANMKQLKTANKPTGLVPGEAAVAILFESDLSLRNSGAKKLATIKCFNAKARTGDALIDEEPVSGAAFSSSISETLSTLDVNKPFEGAVYVDLNGEVWRAVEYGSVRVRLPTAILSADAIEIVPALSIGDIGVVHMACCLCMAIESKRRGYAKANYAVIIASSASGAVGSLAVEMH